MHFACHRIVVYYKAECFVDKDIGKLIGRQLRCYLVGSAAAPCFTTDDRYSWVSILAFACAKCAQCARS